MSELVAVLVREVGECLEVLRVERDPERREQLEVLRQDGFGHTPPMDEAKLYSLMHG